MRFGMGIMRWGWGGLGLRDERDGGGGVEKGELRRCLDGAKVKRQGARWVVVHRGVGSSGISNHSTAEERAR